MILKENVSVKEHNTFGIDAKARYFAEYSSVEQLRDLIRQRTTFVNSKGEVLPILHIGGGSNLLFVADYQGLVLHSAIKGVEVLQESAEDVVIRVGAGMVWDDLVALSLARGWYGLENLSHIPGEVGASAVQNIGAYGTEVKDFIVNVERVDLQSAEPSMVAGADCQYGYRYSIFKSDALRGRYAVTYVHYRLSKQFMPHLEYGGLRASLSRYGIDSDTLTAEELRRVIILTRDGKLPDPKVLGNAGSFFMNPIVERSRFEELYELYPTMPHYEIDEAHVKIPAGWFIEQSGWKGRRLGQAGVYERQALVLVNYGGSTGADIVRLCEAVRHDVQQKFGIDIHPEVNFIS